jgi:uncharacterized protein (DUF1778 family)
MGYEYHDRRRNRLGQFVTNHHDAQIHMYCTVKERRLIRSAAFYAGEEMSAFCRRAAIARAKGTLTGNGETSTNGEDGINGAQ